MYEPDRGDVLNFAWSNKFGFLIRLRNYYDYGYDRERNKWTHTAIVGAVDVKNKQAIVYEAVSGGVREIKISYKRLNKLINKGKLKVGRPKVRLYNVQRECKKWLGKPYAFHQIFIFGYSIFGYSLLKRFSTARMVICSELTSRILYNSSDKELNLSKEFKKNWDYITPLDISYSKQFNWIKK